MLHANENRSRSQAPAVAADRVTLAHGRHVALADATFSIPRGRATAVIGPNGSGKSTVLNAIGGLLTPVRGTLHVDAEGGTAYVPQHLHANPHLPVSVREVVTMGRFAHRGVFGRLDAHDRAAVTATMARLDVERFARRQYADLSAGERQRVLVAQALAEEADLVLLDEPLNGLDLPSQERILGVIDEERALGRTVVATTHSLTDAAGADHLILLAGRVVAEGPPDEVLTEANLREAYGDMVVRVGQGRLMLDDTPHHHPN